MASLVVDLLVLIATVTSLALIYFRWCYSYWDRKNVFNHSPRFQYGNFRSLISFNEHIGEMLQRHYMELKSKGLKHGGIYMLSSPIYVPVDPSIIRNIMQKDFQHFTDRGTYFNERDDPLSAHLFAIEGEKWKTLRAKMTPTFTSGKMKMMFQILVQCGTELDKAMRRLSLDSEAVSIKEVSGCFTMDVIGSCAFGIDCKSFTDPDSKYALAIRKMFTLTKSERLKRLFGISFPKLARKLRFVTLPKETTDFYLNVVKETVKYREETDTRRQDFMQILIDLKNAEEGGLTIEELAAQAFVFFIAGFETSSTTMAFCLFELAQAPDVQQNVRDEINVILEKYDGKLTYEAVHEMKYMDQVIHETLRKYPPLPTHFRRCTQTYKVPETDVVIEKGVTVLIPTLGIQKDPEYFPDPEKFDPERFNEENRKHIKPFTYMPFGEGPRVCIGLRFGVIQTKVGLAILLGKYGFTLSKRTQMPTKMSAYSQVLTAVGGIWLNVVPVV